MEAKEVTTILGILSSLNSLIAFVAFIVPGFISLRIYERLRGSEGKKIFEAIVDVVIYSFATDVLWVPIFIYVLSKTSGGRQTTALIAVSVVGFVVFPGLLGWGWLELERHLAKRGLVSDPTPKPWDYVFKQVALNQLQLAIIATLSDGSKIGGRYVYPGFASSFPNDEQLHIGETWTIDATGAFVERVKGTYGVLIDKKDCRTVEFFDWAEVEPTLASANGGSNEQREHEPDDDPKGLPGSNGNEPS